MNYYNEWDKDAAAWLRELIKAGLIPPGDVDERSITEIKPHELTKYTQCHFFAGIGGWSLALQLANWPITRPVGTGSCPCQPFSSAGKQLGSADDRHLWPAFFKLIRECRALGQRWTDAIFGEQVESAIAHGWLDEVSSDLEGEGYAVGSAILGAHSVGAPHRRQRLYWVAYADERECGRQPNSKGCESDRDASGWQQGHGVVESSGADGSMDNADCSRLNGQQSTSEGAPRNEARVRLLGDGQSDSPMEHPACDGREQRGSESDGRRLVVGCADGELGDTDLARPQGRGLQSGGQPDLFETWTRGVDFIPCTDGRKRLVKSGIFPLAHGFPSRMGLLRGSGNAIVPQVAAAFIEEAEATGVDSRHGIRLTADCETMEVG